MRFLLILLVLLFASVQSQSLSSEAQYLLRQGNSTVTKALLEYPSPFMDQPLWREAINYGLAAKDAAPTNPEPYGFLGKVYSYVKFFDASWDAYSSFRALGGTPDERQRQQMIYLGRTLGYEFFARNEYATALEYYLVAYHYAPADQEINLQIARSYLANNQADLASAYLRKLDAKHRGEYSRYLETATDHLFYGQSASDAFERGIEQYYLGNLNEARDSFSEATRLDPSFQKAFVWAGWVSLELSQPDLALPYWQGAQALTPHSADMQYFLGLTQNQIRWGVAAYTSFEGAMALYNGGQMPEARAKLREAVSHNPNFSDAWAWLGRIAYEGADYQTSYEAFGKANGLASNETYRYFKEASARQLGIDETPLATRPANLERAAPIQEVRGLETITLSPEPVEDAETLEAVRDETVIDSALGVVVADETATEMLSQGNTLISYSDTTRDSAVETDVSAARPLVLLRTDYDYERDAVETTGAVSFFAVAPNVQRDWQTPVNYAGGTVYQRLEVTGKPSSEAVTYQLCLVPNDDIAIKPACSRAGGLELTETGVYTFAQPLSEFYQYDNIDWSRGISNLMVILRDREGNPVDTVFARERGEDLDLYYPMNVRYSVVLVPEGGAFLGWP